jgi:enoyl-CoA hydratase/carnithine racemase
MAETKGHLRVVEESAAYWRVVFDNPPLNVMGATMFGDLQELLNRMEASPDLRVVVFESANPEFYLAHFDLGDIAGSLDIAQHAQSTNRRSPPARRPTFRRGGGGQGGR